MRLSWWIYVHCNNVFLQTQDHIRVRERTERAEAFVITHWFVLSRWRQGVVESVWCIIPLWRWNITSWLLWWRRRWNITSWLLRWRRRFYCWWWSNLHRKIVIVLPTFWRGWCALFWWWWLPFSELSAKSFCFLALYLSWGWGWYLVCFISLRRGIICEDLQTSVSYRHPSDHRTMQVLPTVRVPAGGSTIIFAGIAHTHWSSKNRTMKYPVPLVPVRARIAWRSVMVVYPRWRKVWDRMATWR